ncbi:MAG: acyl-CoA dehydrogenase [Alphaproteobacteria bacterium]|nr:acyl-CoA dehydrogenase [Alphaproteobacteria bacterium]
MPDRSYLAWPFFEERHRALAQEADAWARNEIAHAIAGLDTDAACRRLVHRLGAAGWLAPVVPAPGKNAGIDVRSLCVLRDICARQDGLADFALAMQGLGSAPIALFGSPAQQQAYLPAAARGEQVAAFALSEPQAGSDVAAMTTRARAEGDGFVLDGTKTWISNAGIADHYIVFARTGDPADPDQAGSRGLSAFIVDATAPGLTVTERIPLIAPHPIGTLAFSACRIGRDKLLGQPGQGFRIAMSTLDIFRPSVGAAALGFARRALDEALDRASAREAFGKKLAEFQLIQQKIADMAVAIDAAALLVYRAAWTKDTGGGRVTRESAMAKLFATEEAQLVIDQAVQIFGGLGVVSGVTVERLYRDIRALRIYEGTSEIQKLVIAGQVLGEHQAEAR